VQLLPAADTKTLKRKTIEGIEPDRPAAAQEVRGGRRVTPLRELENELSATADSWTEGRVRPRGDLPQAIKHGDVRGLRRPSAGPPSTALVRITKSD